MLPRAQIACSRIISCGFESTSTKIDTAPCAMTTDLTLLSAFKILVSARADSSRSIRFSLCCRNATRCPTTPASMMRRTTSRVSLADKEERRRWHCLVDANCRTGLFPMIPWTIEGICDSIALVVIPTMGASSSTKCARGTFSAVGCSRALSTLFQKPSVTTKSPDRPFRDEGSSSCVRRTVSAGGWSRAASASTLFQMARSPHNEGSSPLGTLDEKSNESLYHAASTSLSAAASFGARVFLLSQRFADLSQKT
mmetsp:Transcript_5423/g.10488  ORF Transcript_5423/g.10488 Transcript_5423/m.10488 type:complete len:254 (+) Transcript_5423:1707-2468(+)